MAIVLIGIDDTDNADTPGTGRLARRVAEEMARRGIATLGITGHQFLIHHDIAYTGHNRGVCLAIEWTAPLSELEFVIEIIIQGSAGGSDPGVCIAAADAVKPDVVEWGRAAMREVLCAERAEALAKRHGLFLRPLGGNGGGIIGALASVGLRAEGNEGKYLDLPGLRMLEEVVDEQRLIDLGIQIFHRTAIGTAVGAAKYPAPYKTLNWVRPRLIGGRPVWPVEWSEDDHAWVGVDRRKTKSVE